MPQNTTNENTNGRESKRDSSPNAATSAAASNNKKSNRGFASMDSSKQREIASKGGRAAHQKGTAHQFTPDEAREAGRKGGGTVSQDRTHMAEIGRIGGQSRGRRMQRGASGSDAPPASETIATAPKAESSDDESERETVVNEVPAQSKTAEYRH